MTFRRRNVISEVAIVAQMQQRHKPVKSGSKLVTYVAKGIICSKDTTSPADEKEQTQGYKI